MTKVVGGKLPPKHNFVPDVDGVGKLIVPTCARCGQDRDAPVHDVAPSSGERP